MAKIFSTYFLIISQQWFRSKARIILNTLVCTYKFKIVENPPHCPERSCITSFDLIIKHGKKMGKLSRRKKNTYLVLVNYAYPIHKNASKVPRK